MLHKLLILVVEYKYFSVEKTQNMKTIKLKEFDTRK